MSVSLPTLLYPEVIQMIKIFTKAAAHFPWKMLRPPSGCFRYRLA